MFEVVRYHPSPEELSYTFGGRQPVRRVRPGTVLELYTEDCFAGRVRSVDDRALSRRTLTGSRFDGPNVRMLGSRAGYYSRRSHHERVIQAVKEGADVEIQSPWMPPAPLPGLSTA